MNAIEMIKSYKGYYKQKTVNAALFMKVYAVNEDIKLPIDCKIMSKKMRRVLRRGKYENSEKRASKAILGPGDIVLELGAGIGFMSSFLRRHTPVGSIVVYEANPDLIPYIRHVHELNDIEDVEVRHGVVLNNPTCSNVTFHIREDFWASSLSSDEAGVIRSVNVPVVDWNDVLEEIRPTALVMDIEDGEAELLDSAAMGSIRKAIIELHAAQCNVGGMAKIYSSLACQGFQFRPNLASGPVIALERLD